MGTYPTLNARKPAVALLWASLIMGLVGCGTSHQMPLTHDVLATPQQRFSAHIVMQEQAVDRRESPGQIGQMTATLFAIPSGSVETTNPVGVEVVMQVKEALESTGYQITLAKAPYSDPLPANILKVQINEFHFKNYSWFAPLVFTWGDIALKLTLEDHESKVLFARTFHQSGNSYRPFDGFEVAIKEALTEILNQIVTASSTEEFRRALKS